ncbi:hypothetical protein BIW11_02810 [Tropilaelaps mercedesae]|uniref:Uncharacterized protein n=1 Tax=Tropilaelaps mercedesae TaxID=418985 RepID=A0A1V9XXB0_9ACAR|nr:hypothetical protein BIW11_02810 [Tropilaelaps mercedesae]
MANQSLIFLSVEEGATRNRLVGPEVEIYAPDQGVVLRCPESFEKEIQTEGTLVPQTHDGRYKAKQRSRLYHKGHARGGSDSDGRGDGTEKGWRGCLRPMSDFFDNIRRSRSGHRTDRSELLTGGKDDKKKSKMTKNKKGKETQIDASKKSKAGKKTKAGGKSKAPKTKAKTEKTQKGAKTGKTLQSAKSKGAKSKKAKTKGAKSKAAKTKGAKSALAKSKASKAGKKTEKMKSKKDAQPHQLRNLSHQSRVLLLPNLRLLQQL